MTTPAGDQGRFGGNSNPQRPQAQAPSGGGGNVFTRKMGPLPLWAWMGLALAAALIFAIWKKNKTASSSTNSGSLSITPPGSSADQTTAASQIPQFVNLTNVSNSQSQTQTAQGGTVTATVPPATPTTPASPAKTPAPTTPANTSKYVTVTVGQWPSGSGGNPSAAENSFGAGTAAWNSTLWGIATHYNVPGGYQALASLNGISNPNLIYPGQQIKVPVT